MKENELKEIVNKIFQAIFNKDNTLEIEDLKKKFAFDIKLPLEVSDSITGEATYAMSINSHKFITNVNMIKRDETEGWMVPKREVHSLKELLDIWDSINYTTTERVYNSSNVVMSDPIYDSSNVYNSTDCRKVEKVLFCDGIGNSSYALACQRSSTVNYSIRVDDSNTVTNSYNVICSARISNSFFIQDCSDLFECIFCSHISNKEYCISNMQFTKEEYYFLKDKIIEWILAK